MKIRDVRAEEIDIRIGQVGQNAGWVSLLLYKDARCDMAILDEAVGAENWQREHYECKGNLFCRVGIKTPEGWVWKSDCGTESNTEAQKGEASDSFKRACVNWGIGRELYTSPAIFIRQSDRNGEINYDTKEHKGKLIPDAVFEVKGLLVEDKKITGLIIENTKLKKTVYSFGNKAKMRGFNEVTPC